MRTRKKNVHAPFFPLNVLIPLHFLSKINMHDYNNKKKKKNIIKKTAEKSHFGVNFSYSLKREKRVSFRVTKKVALFYQREMDFLRVSKRPLFYNTTKYYFCSHEGTLYLYKMKSV